MIHSSFFVNPMSFLSFRSFYHRGPSTGGLCDASPTIVINASNPIVKYPSTSTFFDALSIPGPVLRSNTLGAVLSANLPVNTSRIEYIGFFPTNLSSYGYCLDTCLPNNILAMNGTNSSTTGNPGPSLFTLLSISVDPKEQHTLTVYNLPDPVAGNTGNITFHSLVATVNDGCGGLPQPLLNDTHRVDPGSGHTSSPISTSNSSTISITSFKGQEPTFPCSSGAQALAQPGATDTQDSKSVISTTVEPASASESAVL
ncbi:hypothetical protein BD779DRAFT_17466 [Infundibulicybe gibba]|nr:hypothetical protein BD779DRAFT_17466 [Infundibulicybe gibba]